MFGILHLIHSPLLVIFPFMIQTYSTDILYIIYFFVIMFLYTFLDGECPISYICKVRLDKKYIAGSNITYYPEMESILPSKMIDYYFGTTTILYLISLFFVMFRTNTFSYVFVFIFLLLLIYFLIVRKFSIKRHLLFQEIVKCILFFTICFLGFKYKM